MNKKILLSIVILTGALGQLYNHYVNGITYNKLVARDKAGFVVDGIKVKVTASEAEVEAYKELISTEVPKDLKAQLKDVKQQQKKMMEKLDATAGIGNTQAKAGEQQGEVVAGSSGPGLEDGPPSLPPVPPEPGSLPDLPENPEAGDLPAETEQADLPKEPAMELPPVPGDISEPPKQSSNSEKEMPESSDSSGLAEEDKVADTEPAEETKPETDVGQIEPPKKQKPKFDPIKELAARNLMSCKTKNSKGRIPTLIWNYIVSRATATEYVTTGDETLPQIAVTVLNDESCWPKIWSQNPVLENPYDIPSGLTISVIPDAPRIPANEEDSTSQDAEASAAEETSPEAP